MKTFIQITEVWVPNRTRDALEFHSGLYGPHRRFGQASARMAFGCDEGLPGKAWAARHPIVLKDLQHSYFRRAELARDAGLSCGIALPIFAGEHLLAVLVMFCAQDAEAVGALEVWHQDARIGPELALDDGYYGLLDGFEFSSRHTRFPRGSGLPGLVWESGMPVVIPDLGQSKRFLRRDEARNRGLCTGLGLPSPYQPGQTWVIAFLSALGTPIARRFEVWAPDPHGQTLQFRSGHCDQDAQHARNGEALSVERGQGCLGRAYATGIPSLTESLAEDSAPNARAAASVGLGSMIAIPVLEQGRTTAIVGLYF